MCGARFVASFSYTATCTYLAGGMKDGRRVASIGRVVQLGNLGFLNMTTLRMETPSLQRIRAVAEA